MLQSDTSIQTVERSDKPRPTVLRAVPVLQSDYLSLRISILKIEMVPHFGY